MVRLCQTLGVDHPKNRSGDAGVALIGCDGPRVCFRLVSILAYRDLYCRLFG